MLVRGGSYEYPQSMFWIKTKKNAYSCIHQFHYIKVESTWVYSFPDVLFMGSNFKHINYMTKINLDSFYTHNIM